MVKYKIIDNFLSDSDFAELKNNVLPQKISDIGWVYNGELTSAEIPEPHHLKKVTDIELLNPIHNWFFTNLLSFSSLYIPHPPFLNVLLDKIDPLAVYRIQANFTVQQEKRGRDLFHMDHQLAPSMITSIFYMNTTNGSTILEDGTEIECRENRLVSYPYNTYHAGVRCTDQLYRIVINLNYFLDKK